MLFWFLISEMKEFAKQFYKGEAWQNCRAEYIQKVGGLCEDCLAKGIYKPGVIVHHIEHVTPKTIDNPEITLNHGNLRLVCRDCHAEEHKTERSRRYIVDAEGNVTTP